MRKEGLEFANRSQSARKYWREVIVQKKKLKGRKKGKEEEEKLERTK